MLISKLGVSLTLRGQSTQKLPFFQGLFGIKPLEESPTFVVFALKNQRLQII